MSDRQTRWRNLAGIAFGLLLVVGFGLGRVLGGMPSPGGATCSEPLAWHEAGDAVGNRAAVAGPVTAAAFKPDVGGAPTFLNLGNAHPDPQRFDVVIYEDVREEFTEPPEERFAGADVCVVGNVRDREGVPQVVLDSPLSIAER